MKHPARSQRDVRQRRQRPVTGRVMGAGLAVLLAAVPVAVLLAAAPVAAQTGEELARQVEIRRTTHGVPHILAENIRAAGFADRKSTRLNSSHVKISYAVF